MNNSYHTEQDDCDEMSGYNKAKRMAKIKHESLLHTAKIPLGNWLVAAIVFALIWYSCAGCTSRYESRVSIIDGRFDLTVIDSCEYIVVRSNDYIIHKANCNNPEHDIRNK